MAEHAWMLAIYLCVVFTKVRDLGFNMAHNADHQWCTGFPTRLHFLRVSHYPESASPAGNPAYTYESKTGIHIQTTAS